MSFKFATLLQAFYTEYFATVWRPNDSPIRQTKKWLGLFKTQSEERVVFMYGAWFCNMLLIFMLFICCICSVKFSDWYHSLTPCAWQTRVSVAVYYLDFSEILLIRISGPRQANLVLIAYASSEGSGEPAHPRSLARTFAARSYKQWVKRNLQTESQIPGLSEWLGMRS